MTFYEYFKDILAVPLLEDEKIQIIYEVVSEQLDEFMDVLVEVKKEFFISLADYNFSNLAKERGITKLKYEDEDSFKNRAVYALLFYRSSSTKEGLEAILKLCTTKTFTLTESYKGAWIFGKSRFGINTYAYSSESANTIILEFFQMLTDEEKTYITQILDLYKPAHVAVYIKEPLEENQKVWLLGERSFGLTTYIGG